MPKMAWPFFFFQAEDGIRDYKVTGVQTCALPISTLAGGLGYFEYTVSATTQTTSAASPATGDFTLGLPSREAGGTAGKVVISTLLDLDLPTGAVVTPVPSNRAGVPAGTLLEDFDTDFDGNGKVDLSDGRNGQLNDTFG